MRFEGHWNCLITSYWKTLDKWMCLLRRLSNANPPDDWQEFWHLQSALHRSPTIVIYSFASHLREHGALAVGLAPEAKGRWAARVLHFGALDSSELLA